MIKNYNQSFDLDREMGLAVTVHLHR